MEDVLARLALGELFNPLRLIMFPPGPAGMGLMPAFRGGEAPAFALKEIVVAPENSARGLDPHQGAVLLHDGITGELVAIMNASPVTEIRTAAVSGAATKALARTGARSVAHPRLRRAGPLPRRRDADGARRSDHPDLEPKPGACRGTRTLETHSLVAGSVEEALDGADVICTTTAARDPIRRARLARSRSARQRRGGSVPSARELSSETVAAATLFVDRRESTLNESGTTS